MKSFKAKGKRLTTFEVDTINELEPIRFKPENEPEDEPDSGEEPTGNGADLPESPDDTPKNVEEDEKEVFDRQKYIEDITGQMSLF